MPTIAEVREKFPQYNDMSDTALGDALHRKFYSDMPKEEFDRKIGLAPVEAPAKPEQTKRGIAETFGRGAVQGATFNFGDEIAGVRDAAPKVAGYNIPDFVGPIPARGLAGLGRLAYGQLTGDEAPAADYARGRDEFRTAVKEGEEQNPVTSFAGNMTGGLATTAIPGMGVARGATWLQRLAQGARAGGIGGAASGVGAGEDAESRTTGGVLGGAIGSAIGGPLGAAFGSRVRPPAVPGTTGREVAEAADNIGARVPRGILSDNPDIQAATVASQQLPVAGRLATNAIREANTGIEDAVTRGVANLSQGGTDRASVGAGARSAIERGIERSDVRADRAYARLRNQIADGGNAEAPVAREVLAPLNNIVQQRIAAGETGIPIDGLTKAIDLLTRPQGASFNGLQRARTEISKAINWEQRNQGFITGDLKQTYNALTDAMEQTVRQTATRSPDEAAQALTHANGLFGRISDQNRELQRFLGHGSDERIVDRILAFGSNKAGRGDIAQMNTLRRSMQPGDWNSVSAAAMQRMGLNNKGEFSTQFFANSYQNMTPAAREMLFGRTGTATRQHIDDIMTVSRRMNEAGQFRNTSNTARATLLGAGLYGIGNAVTDPMDATKDAMKFAGVSLPMAYLLTRPASAASMARWSSAYSNLVTQPTAVAQSAFTVASRNFAHTLGDMTGVKIDPGVFLKAISNKNADQQQQ